MSELSERIDNADPHEHGDNWNLLMEALDALTESDKEIERRTAENMRYEKYIDIQANEILEHEQTIATLTAELEHHKGKAEVWEDAARAAQARVEALEKVRAAVLKHRDNKEFLNMDTWNACVYAAEAATEHETGNE